MKALVLGATGLVGKQTAARLVNERLISEVGIGSRNLETAERVASEIGEKARAVCVQIFDLPHLVSVASGYDLIVNAAGPTSEVQIPAIRAAIEAGVHYCDLGVSRRYAEEALKLDTQARERGISAVIASGWFGVTSLMAVHAYHQLDQVEQLTAAFLFDYTPGDYYSPDQSLARAREAGKVDTSWDLMETAGSQVLTYRGGSWVHLDPLENAVEIVHPMGSMIRAYLIDSPNILTLPEYLPGVKNVSCVLGMVPPQLMELFIRKSQRIARGETDWRGAAMDFFETAVAENESWLVSPPDYPRDWWMWVIADGTKEGRSGRYLCWPSMLFGWTTVPLVITALRILRGEVTRRGVMQSEACFELESFLEEVRKYIREESRGQALLNERFEWIE